MNRDLFSPFHAAVWRADSAHGDGFRRQLPGFLLPIVAFILSAALAGCGPPTPLQLDQQLMTATTSPIPGATAKLLPPTGPQSNAQANFCVTSAGYCPLAAAAAAGQNCICQAGSLMYGGTTSAAPKTYKAPLIGP
jgi:hypothetical protein